MFMRFRYFLLIFLSVSSLNFQLNAVSVQQLLSENQITIANLEDRGDLTVLNLSNRNIDSLNGIGNISAQIGAFEGVDLSNNQLKKVTENDLKGLKSIEFLNLNKNKISAFHLKDFNRLGTLLLRGNRLTEGSLTGSVLSDISGLQVLDLRDNQIESLCTQIFGKNVMYHTNGGSTLTGNGLANLKKLYLSGNKIGNITNGTKDIFAGLENLEILDLGNCDISGTLKSYSLKHLKKLKILVLWNNRIREIEAGAFDDLESLKELYLNNNRLVGGLKVNLFKQLRKLEILHLGGNFFHKIYKGVFKDLENLKELYLLANNIQSLEQNCFTGLSELEVLDLSFNEIQELEKGCFNCLSNLKTLSLMNNQIRRLQANSFYGLGELAHLYFNNNKAKSINSNSFFSLKNLKEIDLRGNNALALKAIFKGYLSWIRVRAECLPRRVFKKAWKAFVDKLPWVKRPSKIEKVIALNGVQSDFDFESYLNLLKRYYRNLSVSKVKEIKHSFFYQSGMPLCIR